ncbi:unnamed protein product, partial [Ixodes hexagonus]
TSLDFTKDENFWACLIGLSATVLYRSGIDQTLFQRFLAAKNLEDAQRTALVGMVLLSLFYGGLAGMAMLLIYWSRECDPQLSGAIKQFDQEGN